MARWLHGPDAKITTTKDTKDYEGGLFDFSFVQLRAPCGWEVLGVV